jgi:hypothetical protein
MTDDLAQWRQDLESIRLMEERHRQGEHDEAKKLAKDIQDTSVAYIAVTVKSKPARTVGVAARGWRVGLG